MLVETTQNLHFQQCLKVNLAPVSDYLDGNWLTCLVVKTLQRTNLEQAIEDLHRTRKQPHLKDDACYTHAFDFFYLVAICNVIV